jgi:hypothetical protein
LFIDRLTTDVCPAEDIVIQSGEMDIDTTVSEPVKSDADAMCPKVSPHPWKALRISRALKKRGRPKGQDKSLFSAFHNRRVGGAAKKRVHGTNANNGRPEKRLRKHNVIKRL